jgi:hypothetical protein
MHQNLVQVDKKITLDQQKMGLNSRKIYGCCSIKRNKKKLALICCNRVFGNPNVIITLGNRLSLIFNALRRSGATLAFSKSVYFSAIQAHGIWTDDALWSYIDPSTWDPAVFFQGFIFFIALYSPSWVL